MGDKSHPVFPSVPFLFSATTPPVPVPGRNQRWRPATSNAGGIKSTLTPLTPNIFFQSLCLFTLFPSCSSWCQCILQRNFSPVSFAVPWLCFRVLTPCIQVKPKELSNTFLLLFLSPPRKTSQQGCLLISSFAKIRNVAFLWPFWTIRILESPRWVAVISSFWLLTMIKQDKGCAQSCGVSIRP